MKSFRVFLHICILSTLGIPAAQAASLTGIMLINPGLKAGGAYASGSYFAMGANNPNSNSAMLTPSLAPGPGGIVLGSHQNFVLNPDVPHPDNWDGKGGKPGTGYSGTPTTPADIVNTFSFFGTATYVGTNPISYQSGISRSAPTADVDMSSCVGNTCTLSVDLSAWEVMWNGSAFEQGPRPLNTGPFVAATGTYDLLTHAYSLSWASQINGGPFNGVTGYWHLEGTMVPVPAAIWLLASGLLGLVGLARRKRLS